MLNEKLNRLRDVHGQMKAELQRVIVGQEEVLDQLLLAILTRGHCLLVGVPGLAKTLMISSLAKTMDLSFNRIQFTPDLMPTDITGTELLHIDPETSARSFRFEAGPLFANVVLADEINRTPPKTQAALLEAMQERRVTSGGKTHELPQPFFVLATQNPIEQEGTYLLPEAQVDRFMFKLKVGYPTMDEEHIVMQRMASPQPTLTVDPVLTIETLMELREQLGKVFIDPKVERHILRIVDATRNPAKYDLDIGRYLRFGASPRASIYLSLGARGQALMCGRDYTTPQDVKDVAHDILRHRIAISYRAEAEGLNSDDLLDTLLKQVPITEA